jgi:hypothetical protein
MILVGWRSIMMVQRVVVVTLGSIAILMVLVYLIENHSALRREAEYQNHEQPTDYCFDLLVMVIVTPFLSHSAPRELASADPRS